MKIAIIEDDKILAKSLKDILKEYDVKLFFEPSEFLKSKEEFDLFLIDINMPGINGLELLTYIPNKPKIIISAYISEENIDKAFKNGAVDFIKKPIFKAELINKIKNFTNAKIGEYEYNYASRILKSKNRQIILTKSENEFINLFTKNEFVSIEMIEEVTQKSGNSLYIMISRLKKKTGLNFENIKGSGYVLRDA
ncbi:response regulator transcription factor [Caminibacter sp.]